MTRPPTIAPKYCGLDRNCFIPGNGPGTRRCRAGHWDETKPGQLPRLSQDLRVEQPRTCGRKL